MTARVAVFDTTLRDGEQSPGCSMTAAEKVRLARVIEQLGVDAIEAGFPAASPGEAEAVAAVAGEVRAVKVAALARAREDDIVAAARALAGHPRAVIHTFLATSAIHLEHKLKLTPAQALDRAVAGVRLARSLAAEVEFSAEDASRTEYGYLREVLQAAYEAGARTLNVPDTVGFALPHEYAALVARLVRDLPGAVISVHCHDDLGLAVANSLAAVQAGARQVECTLNGIGERAGNASLEEIVVALALRGDALGAATAVRADRLVPASAALSRTTGVWPQPNKAVVGRNAFAHEAGIHQHGVLAHPLCYEVLTPAGVGARETSLVLGKHSGRHAVAARLAALGIPATPEEAEAVTARVKELADRRRYVYDHDLLDLVAHRPQGAVRLLRFQVVSGTGLLPTASVELALDGGVRAASAVGNGPLDAALKAADTALGGGIELLELHTRALTAGADAVAEVTVRVRRADAEATGQAAATDSIQAALQAYLSAVGAAVRANEAAA